MGDQTEVRKAVVEAESDKSLANLVNIELLAVAVLVGYGKSSWGLGVGTFILLFMIFMIPYVRVLAYFAASLCWALLVLRLVDGPEAFRSPSPVVSDPGMLLALFALLASMIAHFAFRRHMADSAPSKAKAQQEASASRTGATQEATELKIDERECPVCAETIKAKATKCRYCGSEVEPASANLSSGNHKLTDQLHLAHGVAQTASTFGSTLASSVAAPNKVQSAPAEPLKKPSMAEKARQRREERKRNHPVLWRSMKLFLFFSFLFAVYATWGMARSRHTPEYELCLQARGDASSQIAKNECTSQTLRQLYFFLDY